MSEEVNLSEVSNNLEEDILDWDELLGYVWELREMIHQLRVPECIPMLKAIFGSTYFQSQPHFMRRMVHGYLQTIIANMSLFQCKKMPDDMLGFLKLYVKTPEKFEIPEMTPEDRTDLVFNAVSELDQLLVDIVR